MSSCVASTLVWPFYRVLAQALVPALGRDAVYDGLTLRPLWDPAVLDALFSVWALPRGVTLTRATCGDHATARLTGPSGVCVVGRGDGPAEALAVGWLSLLRHPAFSAARP